MAGEKLNVEMLPARHGDALWIEWGDPSDRHRMLIDGGPAATFETLCDRFEQLDPTRRRVDLMVVTHIDLDHIDGAIRLLRDRSLDVSYSDVWFNDYHQLSDVPVARGAMQGEFLGAVLHERGVPWNQAFGGGAVVVPPTGSLPSVRLEGGLRLVLLSPTRDKLLELRSKWQKVIEEAGMEPGDRAEALARLEDRMGPVARGAPRATFGGDDSEANGSSIAFVLEYGAERWLLAGDAHEDVLLAGLERYAAEIGVSPVPLDGFKLPHHGSVRNISPALLAAIDCRRFLVSTNGAYFKHPDEACIDLVVSATAKPELVFNYRTPFTEKWAAPSADYETTYAVDGPDAQGARTGRALVEDPGAEPHPRADDGAAPDESDRVDGPQEAGPVAARAREVGAAAETEPEDATGAGARPASRPGRPLHVAVFHGSLERADHPVLVGHYAATRLSGAEGFVDRRFQGRLSDRFVRGLYPAGIGESLLVRAARRRHPQAGVLVVGLGEYGELTPLRLVATVRRALVDHALDEADRRDHDEPVELGISSVLLGATGDQGLSISASVRAIVTATREANLELRAGDTSARAQFTTLQLWERSAAEAELAFRALHALGSDVPAGADGREMDDVRASTELHVAEGALENSLRSDADEQVWWRVRVSEVGARDGGGPTTSPYLQLEFTVGGRLARTGNVVHLVERRRLQRLLREVVGNPAPGPSLHAVLFELLFPNPLKWDMMAAQDIQLEVDDATADIPWEMLAARNPSQGTRGQLALRAPMVRQLRLGDFPAVRRATEPRALVIGNPPAGRLGPSLDGAYREARGVVEVLDGFGYDVTSLCFDTEHPADDRTATAIEQALFENDYRIIHIAAHGLFQPDDPSRTGVVIGPDDFLTAQLFGQFNVTPDLVFLNCCHLGAVATGIESGAIEFTHEHLHRLGASLARQLIDSGVRAVVVAGWAVDDKAADRFARTFYARMLEGETFGRAVWVARQQAWESAIEDVEDRAHPATYPNSTWGAYQCYGDGGYRLPRDVDGESPRTGPTPPVTRAEALRWVESIVHRIESVGIEADRQAACAELELIEQTARQRSWIGGDGGQLGEAIGCGWAALGDHERAIALLDDALRAKDGAMTLRGLERYANYKDRLAAQLLRAPDVGAQDRERAATLVAEAMEAIELLERLSRSGERTALRAAHYKRRASATDGRERADALREAVRLYRASYEQEHRAYTLYNYVQLEEIRRRIDGDESAARSLHGEVDRILSARQLASASDYWDAVGHADGELTVAIIRDEVPQRAASLEARYVAAFDCGSTAGMRASTLDHLRDLADLHPDPVQSAALASLHRELVAGSV